MKKANVLVAMSGGVDSTISAYKLKEKGYNVIGITMQHKENESLDIDVIKKVKYITNKLNIKHIVVDLKKEFKQYVIDFILKCYKDGYIPNPCIICNKFIKFGFLLDNIYKYQTDFFATGHYANVFFKDGEYYLKKAFDQKKDQTYFLYQLNQKQLSKIIFPNANSTKEENIKLAHKIGFNFFNDISGSQDICFIDDIHKFLSDKIGILKGEIRLDDDKKKIIGYHNGFYHFTIGQRKMLTNLKVSTNSGPYFVSKIDPKNNIIYVTNNQNVLYKNKIVLPYIHLINNIKIDKKKIYKAKYRSTGQEFDITLSYNRGKYIYNFLIPQKSINPGQHIVIYDNDIVLGGSMIV